MELQEDAGYIKDGQVCFLKSGLFVLSYLKTTNRHYCTYTCTHTSPKDNRDKDDCKKT